MSNKSTIVNITTTFIRNKIATSTNSAKKRFHSGAIMYS